MTPPVWPPNDPQEPRRPGGPILPPTERKILIFGCVGALLMIGAGILYGAAMAFLTLLGAVVGTLLYAYHLRHPGA